MEKMVKNNRDLEKEIQGILLKYPLLSAQKFSNGNIVLKGRIEIPVIENECDIFSIQIVLDEDFPYRYPKVIELEEKIKRVDDWHVNQDNTLCLKVLPLEMYDCRYGINLHYFMDNVLVPHLAAQAYRMDSEDDKYPFGEYSHGINGIIEFLRKDLFKTNDLSVVKKGLLYVIINDDIDRQRTCFCGSGKKIKKCHYSELQFLESLPIQTLHFLFEIIKSHSSK